MHLSREREYQSTKYVAGYNLFGPLLIVNVVSAFDLDGDANIRERYLDSTRYKLIQPANTKMNGGETHICSQFDVHILSFVVLYGQVVLL
jgi:hypothetical protein